MCNSKLQQITFSAHLWWLRLQWTFPRFSFHGFRGRKRSVAQPKFVDLGKKVHHLIQCRATTDFLQRLRRVLRHNIQANLYFGGDRLAQVLLVQSRYPPDRLAVGQPASPSLQHLLRNVRAILHTHSKRLSLSSFIPHGSCYVCLYPLHVTYA